jgi:hypothetical protein
MATDIRFKRGTTTAVQAYSSSALLGEPVFDIEKKRLYIGTDTTLEEIGGDSFSVEDDTLDDINDGTTYGKVANLDLTSNRIDFDKLSGFSSGVTISYLNQLVDGYISLHGWQGITISDTTGSYDALTITNSGGNGIKITYASGDGIEITNSIGHGILISDSTGDSLHIANSGDNAIEITNATTNGIKIDTAGNYGILISNATSDGIRITDAGGDAIEITNATGDGIKITNAGDNAIEITTATTNGIQIDNSGNYGLLISDSTSDAIHITDAGNYGVSIANCTTGGYGPIYIENAGVSGASNLNTTYTNAAVDTLAIDSNHDLYIKTAVGTWSKVGATASPSGVISSAVIDSTASTDNAVILDADGLTMRKAAGAVRFDVNEDGSFTLGNSGGANLAFTTGDAMTLTSATLTSCSIAGEEIDSGTVAAARIADLSSTYAVASLGVTNGNSHDHAGGDGAQIDHTGLSNIGTNSHSTIDTHISATTNFHGVTASAAEVNRLDTSAGIYITTSNTTENGIHIVDVNSAKNAIYIGGSGNTHAINIVDTGHSALYVAAATYAGVNIASSDALGILINNTTSHGIQIQNTSDAAIRIEDNCVDGLEVEGTSSGAGVNVLSATTYGLKVNLTGSYGIHVDNYTGIGIFIGDAGGGDAHMRLEGHNSPPGSPTEGMIYYNSTSHMLYCHNGTDWQSCF